MFLKKSPHLKNDSGLRFSVVSRQRRRRALVPITPMPHYSDMDTPELKNKLNRSVCSRFYPRAVGMTSPWPGRRRQTNRSPLRAGSASGLYRSAR